MIAVTDGGDTVATYPGPFYCFSCKLCGRWGEYKRATIAAEFPPNMQLPSLLRAFANARGCKLALDDGSPYNFSLNRCQIRYVIARR